MKQNIRLLAICVFRNNDRILVAEGYDPVRNGPFYRPLGGGVEFCEHNEQTIHRELMQEIGVEVRDLKYLGTLGNIFVFDGKPGNEIVHYGVFTDSGLYEQTEITAKRWISMFPLRLFGRKFMNLWRKRPRYIQVV